MPILFEALELMAPDAPANREVMCAFCGTVTSRLYLRSPGLRRPERHAKDDVMVTPNPVAAATAQLRAEELRARAATRPATAPLAALSPCAQPDPSNGDQP